jgi:hypothetical protein
MCVVVLRLPLEGVEKLAAYYCLVEAVLVVGESNERKGKERDCVTSTHVESS